jgi:hypothetical protein
MDTKTNREWTRIGNANGREAEDEEKYEPQICADGRENQNSREKEQGTQKINLTQSRKDAKERQDTE